MQLNSRCLLVCPDATADWSLFFRTRALFGRQQQHQPKQMDVLAKSRTPIGLVSAQFAGLLLITTLVLVLYRRLTNTLNIVVPCSTTN